ncbi:MAG: hypothetical protein GY694_12260 [Gammaproteobacteria bacterium]|nr:hypothetical protein [Gammaproteobacteria bacterium]
MTDLEETKSYIKKYDLFRELKELPMFLKLYNVDTFPPIKEVTSLSTLCDNLTSKLAEFPVDENHLYSNTRLLGNQ